MYFFFIVVFSSFPMYPRVKGTMAEDAHLAAAYLLEAAKDMSCVNEKLSRIVSRRLLRVVGRNMKRERKQSEAKEVLEHVCGGCGNFFVVGRTAELSCVDQSEKLEKIDINLAKYISPEVMGEKFKITCKNCGKTTVSAEQRSIKTVAKQQHAAQQQEQQPPSKKQKKEVLAAPQPKKQPKSNSNNNDNNNNNNNSGNKRKAKQQQQKQTQPQSSFMDFMKQM
eukprot:TRINITY_DN1361_c1_g1_i1.p1 TRINITY_DN1361_c1_g1~~TRINITY_DN1361_c1_g1_i1.p1  ORF type:complete len:223 (+),score=55.19 TRINITY_DN1361_c1_g1_i1:683-1351(+)